MSLPGGEPLLHPRIVEIVDGLVARKKYIYLCTNALLLKEKLEAGWFKPSKYLTFSVHMDGQEEHHDFAVCREGIYETAEKAIRLALSRGFRVTTNTTLFSTTEPDRVRKFFDDMTALGLEGMMVSPGYSYSKAPDQEHFPGVRQTRELFSTAFADGNRKRWRLNHTPLFLDFLEGKIDFECTPWGIPSYSIFGWQRPCYLMGDGYTETYKELIETTDWSQYGRGKDDRCANCMAHCGYEPTAVLHSLSSVKEAFRSLVAR